MKNIHGNTNYRIDPVTLRLFLYCLDKFTIFLETTENTSCSLTLEFYNIVNYLYVIHLFYQFLIDEYEIMSTPKQFLSFRIIHQGYILDKIYPSSSIKLKESLENKCCFARNIVLMHTLKINNNEFD